MLQSLPSKEQEHFFALLAQKAFPSNDNASHEAVFGHLANEEFTAQEAADYLDVSMATFRRYVRDGKIKPTSKIGSSHLYALVHLRELKTAIKLLKNPPPAPLQP